MKVTQNKCMISGVTRFLVEEGCGHIFVVLYRLFGGAHAAYFKYGMKKTEQVFLSLVIFYLSFIIAHQHTAADARY